jgi:hypothetical protein
MFITNRIFYSLYGVKTHDLGDTSISWSLHEADWSTVIQCDSKLLSGFPWPTIFKPETNKTKLLTEYESVTQKVLFGNVVLAALMTSIFRKQFYFVVSGLKKYRAPKPRQ